MEDFDKKIEANQAEIKATVKSEIKATFKAENEAINSKIEATN